MRLIDIWDIDQNFWQLNPQLKLAFKEVYSKDKSTKKKDSSQLMWAVALYTDAKSKFKDLSELERELLIQRDYNPNFSVKKHSNIIEHWKSFLSPMELRLQVFNKFMAEKNDYLKTLNYEENADEIEKRLLSDDKIVEVYKKLKAAVEEEESEGLVKGGSLESLSEKGEI